MQTNIGYNNQFAGIKPPGMIQIDKTLTKPGYAADAAAAGLIVQRAEEAISHYPIIDSDGYWYVWNAVEGHYENSGQIATLQAIVVPRLPVTGENGIIYLVPVLKENNDINYYDEFIWVSEEHSGVPGGRFEPLGSEAGFAFFVATYNETTFTELRNALEEGKTLVCGRDGCTYPCVAADEGNFKFAVIDGKQIHTLDVDVDSVWTSESEDLVKGEDFEHLVDRVDTLEGDLSSVTSRVDELEDRLDTVDQSIEDLKDRADNIEARIATDEENLDSLANAFDEYVIFVEDNYLKKNDELVFQVSYGESSYSDILEEVNRGRFALLKKDNKSYFINNVTNAGITFSTIYRDGNKVYSRAVFVDNNDNWSITGTNELASKSDIDTLTELVQAIATNVEALETRVKALEDAGFLTEEKAEETYLKITDEHTQFVEYGVSTLAEVLEANSKGLVVCKVDDKPFILTNANEDGATFTLIHRVGANTYSRTAFVNPADSWSLSATVKLTDAGDIALLQQQINQIEEQIGDVDVQDLQQQVNELEENLEQNYYTKDEIQPVIEDVLHDIIVMDGNTPMEAEG